MPVLRPATGRRSLPRLETALGHLREEFESSRALAITSDRIDAYETKRLEAGAARASVNYELATLRRAFRLAVKLRRIPSAPSITITDPRNARKGFFERDDFAAVLEQLPDYLRPVMQFAYATGWRVASEVLPLTWDRVDFVAVVVRLEPNTTKNDEGREFPFAVLPDLAAVITTQRAATKAIEKAEGRVIPHVFHRDGEPIKSYKNALSRAIERAARGGSKEATALVTRPQLVGRIVHDFRRTAVRNLEQSGVPRSVATKLTGHRTEAVYRRYAIASAADLRAGVEKLASYMNPPKPAKGTQRGPRKLKVVGGNAGAT